METDNLDSYLEHLRQEYGRAQRLQLEQKRIANEQCAKIREMASELEEAYVALLWQQAELTKRRGTFADLFARLQAP
jgi:hypothetical protein